MIAEKITHDQYQILMLKIKKHLPKGWVEQVIKKVHGSSISGPKYRVLYNKVVNVRAGRSKDITYINAILEVAKKNNPIKINPILHEYYIE